MGNVVSSVVAILLGLLIFVGFLSVGAFILMLLWNFVIADLFHWTPRLTYWHALALGFLLGMIRRAVITFKK